MAGAKKSVGPPLIRGGYILTARNGPESKVIAEGPPLYAKLWDWMRKRASYKDSKELMRGQLITTIEEMREAMGWMQGYRPVKPTVRQIRSAYEHFKEAGMIITTRGTRNLHITISNYSYYQDPGSYEGHSPEIKDNNNILYGKKRITTCSIGHAEGHTESSMRGTQKGTHIKEITDGNDSSLSPDIGHEGHAEGHAKKVMKGYTKGTHSPPHLTSQNIKKEKKGGEALVKDVKEKSYTSFYKGRFFSVSEEWIKETILEDYPWIRELGKKWLLILLKGADEYCEAHPETFSRDPDGRVVNAKNMVRNRIQNYKKWESQKGQGKQTPPMVSPEQMKELREAQILKPEEIEENKEFLKGLRKSKRGGQ